MNTVQDLDPLWRRAFEISGYSCHPIKPEGAWITMKDPRRPEGSRTLRLSPDRRRMVNFRGGQQAMGPVDLVLFLRGIDAPYRPRGPQDPARMEVVRALYPEKYQQGAHRKVLMNARPRFVRPPISARNSGAVLSPTNSAIMRARTSLVAALRGIPPSDFARRAYLARGFSTQDVEEDIRHGHLCDLSNLHEGSGDCITPGAGGLLKPGSRVAAAFPTHPLCFVNWLHLPGDVSFALDAVCRGRGDRQPKALRVAKPPGYNPPNLPWGLPRAEALNRCAGKLAYLAESPFDAIAMRNIAKVTHDRDRFDHQAQGIPLPSWLTADPIALGAFSCTAISHDFFEAIADVCRLVIAFDADDAGKHGADAAARMASEVGIRDVVIHSDFEGEKDPNDQWLKMKGGKK
jgi:hypothetical protein